MSSVRPEHPALAGRQSGAVTEYSIEVLVVFEQIEPPIELLLLF